MTPVGQPRPRDWWFGRTTLIVERGPALRGEFALAYRSTVVPAGTTPAPTPVERIPPVFVHQLEASGPDGGDERQRLDLRGPDPRLGHEDVVDPERRQRGEGGLRERRPPGRRARHLGFAPEPGAMRVVVVAAAEREHLRVGRRVAVDPLPRRIRTDLAAQVLVVAHAAEHHARRDRADHVRQPVRPPGSIAFVERRGRRQVEQEHRDDRPSPRT